MRNHLTLKQIANCLGVKETYAGQAFDPAMTKVVEVYIEHPDELLMMLVEMAKLRRQEKALEEEREIAAREAMSTGRMNRSDLGQTRMAVGRSR